MRPASHAKVPSADIDALRLHEYFSPLSTGLGGRPRYRPDEPQISEEAEHIDFSLASGKRTEIHVLIQNRTLTPSLVPQQAYVLLEAA